MTMFATMRYIAAEKFDTEVICLSEQPHGDDPDIVRVAKPAVSMPRILAAGPCFAVAVSCIPVSTSTRWGCHRAVLGRPVRRGAQLHG